MKILLHRPIEGTIKTLTIRRSTTGKWYACFSVEYDPSPLPQKETAVGIDVGLESFATLSNGEKIENPWFFRTEEKALAKAQRRLSKAEKGTPERKKARKISLHTSMNGSPTDGSISLTRPPGRWWIGSVRLCSRI